MKNKKLLIVICIIIFIYFLGGIFYPYLKKENSVKNIKVDDGIQIKGFDYILYDDDLEIIKKEFKMLKKNLESSNINYIEYSHSISKMFLMDLYTLNNKKNMYDVGGVEYVYPDSKENFKLNVTNTLYNYMKDNSEKNRKQKLPEVKSVTITSEENIKYSILEKEYDGYKIKLDIEYNEDMGYDSTAELLLIRYDKYLYIVEKN